MIDLYTWATPNGWKISILLEELEIPYRVHAINVDAGEQYDPAFRAISPNYKTPVIVDNDAGLEKPLAVFESGAIMIYLAEKCRSDLFSTVAPTRQLVLQWLMFQVGGVGPMFSQAHHFFQFAKQVVPYAQERYLAQVQRHYEALEYRLASVPYLAGEDYSIADIATFPWIVRHEWHHTVLEDYPSVKRWYETLLSRPAVRRGLTVPEVSDHTGPKKMRLPLHE